MKKVMKKDVTPYALAMYSRTMVAGWADVDVNGHMRNTAFLDKAATLRMHFFADHGFPMSEFSRLKIGPVILRDEVDYLREVMLLDEVEVTLAIAGMSEDGSRFRLRNDVLRKDGKVCARITSSGGWLDLVARKLVPPPPSLLAATQALERTDDFVTIETRGRPSA